MAVISKDLGAVTAYAAAVNRGYTGAKEEFETLMASYATVAQQAAESACNASQSATDASQSAQTAETAKGTAQQAATDAQSAASGAQGYAQSAQQSAQSASQSATDAESAKNTAVDAVDGFAAGAQQALDGVNQAGNNWKSLAERQAENSEAWAVGQRDGEDVGSSDPAYHNNAKWYAESVSASAQTASEAAQTATAKAGEAAQSASAAAESARTLTIDATLTQSGQAADSKAVGDEISQIQTGIVLLESGSYADADGMHKSTNLARIRNVYPLAVNEIVEITIPEGYEIWFFRLDSNFRLLGAYGNWLNGNILISDISIANMEYITFAIRKTSGSTSDISDQIETVQSGMSIKREYDVLSEHLSEQQDKCAEMIETGGYTYTGKIVQGTYTNSGILNKLTTRVRMERLLPVSAGTVITIDPGSLNKAYVVWKGSAATNNVVKTTSFTAGIENVEIADDGYFIVAFAYPDNRDIVPSDFDGSITVFDSLPYRNKSAIEAISATYELPEYYTADNYIQNKAARINELGKLSDDVFIFITDVHWERNAKISPALINYLMKNCNISKVFSGGDISDTAKRDAINAYNKAAIGEVHYAVGNHEWFPPETGKSLYYALDYDKNNQYGNFSSHYWYYDNVQAKIRYVVLNAFKHTGSDLETGWEYGFDADQIAWFENTALNIEDGYDVVVITHYFGTNSSKITGASSIENIINDFNTNSETGKVLFIIEGHRHWDAVFNNGPVPCVLTTCDKYDVSNESTLAGYVREKGTLTEQAFDVCCINRDAMSVTFVRIGAKAMDNNDVSIGESGFTFDETLEERTIIMG